MSKLSTLKEAGRLRLTTSLRPVKRNKTRWLGVINMLERYDRLLPSIDDSNSEIAALLPSPIERNKIRLHMAALRDFKSVTESLQRQDITVLESQALFQSLIDEFPIFEFRSYLDTSASIVHNTSFEDAIIHIQSGNEHELLDIEKDTVRSLILPNSQEGDAEADDSTLSFAERALKRQRHQQCKVSAYINTNFLLPTSNHVERLFSMAKRVFSPKRRRLQHRTLEALIFLKQNRSLWNMALVATVVNGMPESDETEPDSEPEDE